MAPPSAISSDVTDLSDVRSMKTTTQAGSSTCIGQTFKIITSGYYMEVYQYERKIFEGPAQLWKQEFGGPVLYNYFKVDPNVGPKPADIVVERTFIIPAVASSIVYYGWMDTRTTSIFPTPSTNLSRENIICQGLQSL